MLRDKIIEILERNRGRFVSGQAMADAAGVTRSAVAKCISVLKNEGYPIHSVNNSGHCLDTECNLLSAAGIKAFLDADSRETAIEVFKSIDSTNSEAKRQVAAGLECDAIFAAEEQTAGRGRRGKSFYSPNGTGLYFTAVLHPNTGLADTTGITAAAAVAVVEEIAQATKKDPKIKWVNDIFIGNKKVCGILTEAVADFESDRVQAIIIGIGINLSTEDFPDELKSIAGNIGIMPNRCELAAKIFLRLKSFCVNLAERSFMDDYRKYSLVLGETVNFTRNGSDYTAKALNISDDGGLEVITADGEKMVLNSGEISIKLR